MNEERQNINIHIYDTDMNVKVPKEDEGKWRKAVPLVNQKLNAYLSAYKGKKGETEIKYYAMIDIALKAITESERNDYSQLTNILSELSSEINECLN